MAIQSDTSRAQYWGNGSTVTPYSVPFYFFDDADLKAVLTNASGVDTPLTLNTDFTVDGAGDPAGGTVVTAAAIPNTSKLTIYREVSAIQPIVYETADKFPAKSHERGLDRVTMVAQQTLRAVGRSLRVRESDGNINELPAVANSVIGLNGSKQPRTYTTSELASFLNLTEQFFDRPLKTFADASERALAVPEFTGQLASQRDNSTLWIADSMDAGDWSAYPAAASIVLSHLVDGILSADAAGRAKMADGFLSADVAGRAKMADSFITLAKIGAGLFTADATGRGKFANGFVNSSLLAAGAAVANMPAGTVVQTVFASVGSFLSVATSMPTDNTIPQSNEGSQILTATITPTSTSNKILVFAFLNGSTAGAGTFNMALFRDSDVSALRAACAYGAGYCYGIPICHLDSPASVAAITYKMRAGGNGVNLYVNGNASGTQNFDGVGQCTLLLMEIKG